MKKEKGFTLIELLAVIIILGLLGLVAYPAIEKTLIDSRNELGETQINTIKNGARNWIADHPYSIPKNDGDELTLSLCQLKIGAYVEQKLINPVTDDMYDCKTKIIVKNNSNRYDYSVDFSNTVEESVPETLAYPNIKIDDDYLVYLKKSEEYKEVNITLNDNETFSLIDKSSGVFASNLESSNYTVSVTYNNNEQMLDTSVVGNNLVTYTVTDIITGVKTTIYRNVIVVNE